MRDLNGDARAIACFRIAATGAAVGQINENLNPLAYDVVRFLALNVHNKANAASIALIGRVV